MTNGTLRLTMAGLIATASVAAGAVQLAALANVTPGEWELKEIGGTQRKAICVADPVQLLQIQHGAANCTRNVLDSDAKAVTVHYTCNGGGNGRTTLTVRSPQAFKLETQGMAGGAPFAVDYEAKRLGDCAPAAAAGTTKPANRR